MHLQQNIVHHMDNREGMPLQPHKETSLIISDPPYFEVKGDFDFVFTSFDQYLEFMEDQARHYKRILADNGSLFLYGHAKKIAYLQVIFDKYFNLENNIAWRVIDRQTQKGTAGYNCFAPVTERILFYSNEITTIEGQTVYPVRAYLRELITKVKGRINYKDINTVFGSATNGGGMANAILSLNKQEPAMITAQQYAALCRWLEVDTAEDYKELRRSFEDLRRPFNNLYSLTDVWDFSQEAHISAKYDHETCKPLKLSRVLVQSCSRPGDTVTIPFAGSGTECEACIIEGRNFYAYETNTAHAQEANERLSYANQKQSLF